MNLQQFIDAQVERLNMMADTQIAIQAIMSTLTKHFGKEKAEQITEMILCKYYQTSILYSNQ